MNRLNPPILAALMVCGLAECATIYRSYRKKVEKSYADGMDHFNRGQFREALGHFEELVSIDPEYQNSGRTKQYIQNIIAAKIEQNYAAGIHLEKMKNPVGAILSFREAIRWNDGDNYKDSGDHIDKLLKEPVVKTAIKGYNDRGTALVTAKQLGASRLQFIEALRIDPDDDTASSAKKKVDKELFASADAAYLAGQEMLKTHNYVGGTNKFREAVYIFPDHLEAQKALRQATAIIANENHYQAGLAALKAGNPIDGLAQLSAIAGGHRDSYGLIQRCHEQIKANMETHFKNAVTLYEQQQLKESLYILRWILVVDPGHDQARKYSELAQKKVDTLEKLGTD